MLGQREHGTARQEVAVAVFRAALPIFESVGDTSRASIAKCNFTHAQTQLENEYGLCIEVVT